MPLSISRYSNIDYTNTYNKNQNYYGKNKINFAGFEPNKFSKNNKNETKILFLSLGASAKLIFDLLNKFLVKNQEINPDDISNQSNDGYKVLYSRDKISDNNFLKKYFINKRRPKEEPVFGKTYELNLFQEIGENVKNFNEAKTEDLVKISLDFIKKYNIKIDSEFEVSLDDYKEPKKINKFLDILIRDIHNQIISQSKEDTPGFYSQDLIVESIIGVLKNIKEQEKAEKYVKIINVLIDNKQQLAVQDYLLSEINSTYFEKIVNYYEKNIDNPVIKEILYSDYRKVIDAKIEIDNRIGIIECILERFNSK